MFFKRSLYRFLFPGLLSFLLLLALLGCDVFPAQYVDGSLFYLGWTENGEVQLNLYDGNKSQQLSYLKDGVHDFALSPDGRNIILSSFTEDGDTMLWMIENDGFQQTLLYTCSQAECANFAWAPDSRRLLFERRELGSDGIAGAPVLWWLDSQTAVVLPVQEDVNLHGANGRLSPDGQWLSYFSPEEEGLFLYNIENGSSRFITNEIGSEAAWSPDSQQLVVPQLDLVILHSQEGDDHQAHEHEYTTAVHLLRIDVATWEQQIISGDIQVDDSVPAWSPDGNWIAFGRRATGAGSARQLWIMRPDGTGARALTDDHSINHGPPIWTEDGQRLVFQQINQGDLASDPGIWLIDVESGEKEELVPAGMQPTWLSHFR